MDRVGTGGAEFFKDVEGDQEICEGVFIVLLVLHYFPYHTYAACDTRDVPDLLCYFKGLLIPFQRPIIITAVLINYSHLMITLCNPGNIANPFGNLKGSLVK